jgi:D-aminopeptidase
VLVQSNMGDWRELTIAGVPVGRALGRGGVRPHPAQGADGSIMVVVATDAPLSDRNLRRLAARALLGIGRTGSSMSHGSGDYVIAFSTHPAVRRPSPGGAPPDTLRTTELGNAAAGALFGAVVEATEEAIVNSLLRATTERGAYATVEALPVDEVRRLVQGAR